MNAETLHSAAALAVRCLAAREIVRDLLGAAYADQVRPYCEHIRQVAAAEGIDTLKASIGIIPYLQDPMSRLVALAATIDIVCEEGRV